MTMEKQRDNPKFYFLFGGELNAYYKWKVATEQANAYSQQQSGQQIPSLMSRPQPLMSHSQPQSLMSQSQSQSQSQPQSLMSQSHSTGGYSQSYSTQPQPLMQPSKCPVCCLRLYMTKLYTLRLYCTSPTPLDAAAGGGADPAPEAVEAAGADCLPAGWPRPAGGGVRLRRPAHYGFLQEGLHCRESQKLMIILFE